MEKANIEKKKSSPKGKVILSIVLAAVVAGAACGGYWYYDSTKYVVSDTAKISSDTLNVSSKIAGRVLEVKVKEGQQVKKGDVLFTLETDQMQIQLNQAQAALDSAEAQLSKTKSGARTQEVAGVQSAVDQANAALDGAVIAKNNLQSSLKDAQSKYNDLLKQMSSFKNSSGKYDTSDTICKLDLAVKAGQLTDAQYTLKVQGIQSLFSAKTQLEAQISQLKSQISAANAQVSAAHAGVNGAKSKLSLTKEGAADEDIKALQNQVKASQATYDLAKLNVDNAKVKSPMDGTVTQVNVLSGDMASPGVGVISIVDFSTIKVTANVKESDIDKVKVGQTVKVTSDDFSGAAFTGTVKEIGLTTASQTNVLSLGTSSSSDEVIPVKVNVDFQGKLVKPGMTVTAKIRTEK